MEAAFDSPFAFAPPPLPPAPSSRPGTAQEPRHSLDGLGNALVDSRASLSQLAMPLLPAGDDAAAHHLRLDASHATLHTALNTRPFTAPSSYPPASLYAASYAPDHAVHPSGPLSWAPVHAAPYYAHASASPVNYLDGGLFDTSTGRRASRPDLATLPDEPQRASGVPQYADYRPLVFQHHAPPNGLFQQHSRPSTATDAPPGTTSLGHVMPRPVEDAWPHSRPSTSSSRPDTASSVATSTTLGPDDYGFAGHGVAGQHGPKKRPRRKFEEIERMYGCNYPGCTKAYGTLNHLNAHVAMQKHGPKRVPSEFKEMRRAWRDRKKAEAAERAEREANGLGSRTPTPPSAQTPQEPHFAHPADAAVPSVLSAIPQYPRVQAAHPQPPLFAFQPPMLPTLQRNQADAAGSLRPQTAPAPLAFPQPMRPQTAPTFAFFPHGSDGDGSSSSPTDERVPPPYRHSLPSGMAATAAPMPESPFRRSSLPSAPLMPALPELSAEAFAEPGVIY